MYRERLVTPKGKDCMELVLDRHIEKAEAIRGGKAHLAGTRITVTDVVVWHLHRGLALEEIAVNYDLEMSAVYAALAYYYDHKAEVDAALEKNRRYYESNKESAPSLLREKLKTHSHA